MWLFHLHSRLEISMPRHDQYGTHDERGRGPTRARHEPAPGHGRGAEGPRGRHIPNYGSRGERDARTSTGGDGAAFQGRDYERENYGGGYGTQRKSRDVAEGGRKSEGKHHQRVPQEWRGQVGGDGMDGLASERAFGSDEDQQMSKMDTDQHYRRWRDSELASHDEEYRDWRRKQARRYDEDYARWKASRTPPKARF
jgi:hypothetical protein